MDRRALTPLQISRPRRLSIKTKAVDKPIASVKNLRFEDGLFFKSVTGLTLVELIIVIVLVVIITGAIGLVFRGGLSAWTAGQNEVLLQSEMQRIMEEIIEGTDEFSGIREALEIIEATPVSLSFVPVWTDLYPKYDKDLKEFNLGKKFKPGSFLPIGQIRTSDSKEFVSMPVSFVKNNAGMSTAVKFTGPIPAGSDVRILYHPDAGDDSSVIMRYWWDKKKGRIFRIYNGKTEDIIRRNKKLKITDCKFSYYDNLNRMIAVREGGSGRNIKGSSLSAIGIDFIAEQDSVERELSSFVGARSLGGNLGSSLSLSEGTEVNIPDSGHIRTLVLDNIRAKDGDRLEVEIVPASGAAWKASVNFGVVSDEPYILGFNIEYPKGSVVYTNTRQRPVKGGFNFLKFGDDYYDYDDDINTDDIVNIISDNVVFKVAKMDLEAAALFVRP